MVVQEEDTQDIKEPLIKPLSHQTFSILEKNIPETRVHQMKYILMSSIPRSFLLVLWIIQLWQGLSLL